MKGQNPSEIKASEPKSAEAELREQGLRILARIIARMHVRDIQPGREPDEEAIAMSLGSFT